MGEVDTSFPFKSFGRSGYIFPFQKLCEFDILDED